MSVEEEEGGYKQRREWRRRSSYGRREWKKRRGSTYSWREWRRRVRPYRAGGGGGRRMGSTNR